MPSESSPHSEVFTVAVHAAEEGGYWGQVLELPGCASQGETLDELRENIADAIAGCVAVLIEDGEWPLTESVSTMSIRVSVP